MIDLTTMTDDELAAYRQAADEEIQAVRLRKVAVADEVARRDLLERSRTLSDEELETALRLRQEISGVGGIASEELVRLGG